MKPRFPKPQKVKEPAYVKWVKVQECLMYIPCDNDCWLPLDPHHTVKGDDRSCVPLCRKHHRLITDTPKSEQRRKLGYSNDDLRKISKRLYRRWKTER